MDVSACLGLIFFHCFFLEELEESLLRGMLALPQYTLKPRWMEVRLGANKNLSVMVFRDGGSYSNTPLITAEPG